jgi:hypothetical protein
MTLLSISAPATKPLVRRSTPTPACASVGPRWASGRAAARARPPRALCRPCTRLGTTDVILRRKQAAQIVRRSG